MDTVFYFDSEKYLNIKREGLSNGLTMLIETPPPPPPPQKKKKKKKKSGLLLSARKHETAVIT